MKKIIIILSSIIVIIFIILMIFLFNTNSKEKDIKEVKENETKEEITKEEDNEFSKLSYYKEENLDRYKAYQINNSDLSIEDIVTKVNLNLDKEPYTDTIPSTNLNTNYLLVNKFNYLDSNYIPQENFLISLLYTYVLIFLIKDKSELSMNDEIAMAHTVTRGCLFDMRGIKTDAIEACVAPQICGICIGKLLSSGIPQRDINLVNSELKRIKRIRYYELLLYFQKHPVKSMIIMAIASLLLNVISNLITDIIIHFL